eukprot:CAMPEP_0185441366 /NCGR_PEP_ID=MMETSP1365-20130426/42233_1 /TAXON_ID=38817 /ORGANISM="Gephyrocapsa oceanica, Strain RCC1303" /LENGTH=107 /DNA_ID=CAMNT_0028046827 /DNA_START=24 /DNA_END=344 /DNA_ORIENTATION=+
MMEAIGESGPAAAPAAPLPEAPDPDDPFGMPPLAMDPGQPPAGFGADLLSEPLPDVAPPGVVLPAAAPEPAGLLDVDLDPPPGVPFAPPAPTPPSDPTAPLPGTVTD